MIRAEHIKKAIDYDIYLKAVEKLAALGQSSGSIQKESYVDFTRINVHRMQRLNKTTQLIPELTVVLKQIESDFIWLVLTESWCGDAAQSLPVFHCMEKICPRIQMKMIWRDENPEIMDLYLSDGKRAIPKLICLEKQSLKPVFQWGPRPAEAQELAIELTKQNINKEEKSLAVQKWYNQDKTLSVQKEMLQLIQDHLITAKS